MVVLNLIVCGSVLLCAVSVAATYFTPPAVRQIRTSLTSAEHLEYTTPPEIVPAVSRV